MSSHQSALVHIATSAYQSPELFHAKVATDVGLLAESLLYYETAFIDSGSPDQFPIFLRAFLDKGLSIADLIYLVRKRVVVFVHGGSVHPYVEVNHKTDPPDPQTINGFYSITEEGRGGSAYFANKFLDTEKVRSVFTDGKSLRTKDYETFCRLVDDSKQVLDVNIVSDGLVKTSYAEFLDSAEHEELLGDVLEGYAKSEGFDLVTTPSVKVRRIPSTSVGNYRRSDWTIVRNSEQQPGLTWAVLAKAELSRFRDSSAIARMARTFPLSYAGITSLAVKTAGMLSADLCLPAPLSRRVGKKLSRLNQYEGDLPSFKSQDIVQKLGAIVAFPDLRRLVNAGDVDLKFAFDFREEAEPFRKWLQTTEAERDPDLWHEYHVGVAKKLPEGVPTKPVVVFGFLQSEVLKRLAERAIDGGRGPDTEDVLRLRQLATETREDAKATALDEMFNYGTELGLKWRPICFGRLYTSKIQTNSLHDT
jgi:hypothetical protein